MVLVACLTLEPEGKVMRKTICGIVVVLLLFATVLAVGCDRATPTSPNVAQASLQLNVQGNCPKSFELWPLHCPLDPTPPCVDLLKAELSLNDPYLLDEKGNQDGYVCARRVYGSYYSFIDNRLPL